MKFSYFSLNPSVCRTSRSSADSVLKRPMASLMMSVSSRFGWSAVILFLFSSSQSWKPVFGLKRQNNMTTGLVHLTDSERCRWNGPSRKAQCRHLNNSAWTSKHTQSLWLFPKFDQSVTMTIPNRLNCKKIYLLFSVSSTVDAGGSTWGCLCCSVGDSTCSLLAALVIWSRVDCVWRQIQIRGVFYIWNIPNEIL